MSKKRGQSDLDEYIFTRPEMAKLLNISTNALRMRMRKGKCDLDYRFDGKQFLFKRPDKDRMTSMIQDHPQTAHEKAIYDYDKKVQKKYNRGATHKGKAKYPNEAFKLKNEMMVMNHIQGRFKSEAHRKEFEKLNEEGLRIAQENLRKKADKSVQYSNRPKYGGMIRGSGEHYKLPYKPIDPYEDPVKYNGPDTSFHLGGRPYSEMHKGTGFGSHDDGSVEIDPRDFPKDDREPTFSSKIEEEIWRLKNKK